MNSLVEAEDYLSVGKIVGIHGLKGALRLLSYAESAAIFQSNTRMRLRNDSGQEKAYPIRWVKPHSRGMLLALEGVNNRDDAAALVGFELFIKKSLLPELEEGTYYWSDIIGLAVYDTTGVFLGRVTSILPTGSNDVYVVRDDGDEILVPALESVVSCIDLAAGRMTVELPEGL